MALAVDLGSSRYERQERITWWDQSRLAQARILVAGAGALGNEIVKNLVLVGVGSVLVVDFDRIEASNLSRCVFFRPGDDGAPKASTLARRAQELNPSVAVDALDADLRTLSTGVACRADVIVGALDNREARLYLNRLARRVGKPWVDGAIEALQGVARVFGPNGPCYECTLTDADFEQLAHRQSCRLLSREDLDSGRVPTTATTASIVAGIQAQEVVKILHRDRPGVTVLEGAVVVDGVNNDTYVIRYSERDDCYAHHTYAELLELECDAATTPRAIAGRAGLGEALVELGDDHVVEWRCTHCGTQSADGRIVSLLTFDDARCPVCGEARQPRTISSVAVPGERADSTLRELGVRDDEVLAVRRGTDYRYVWARSVDGRLPDAWA